MNRRCLVVEDETALGDMLCDNLADAGFTAERAEDGRAALDRLARGGIDVVVLDLMLPEIDGFGVLEAMRARGDHTPVLVLSALSDDADRIRALEKLADDYLTKPFNLRELLLRVRALLRRRPVFDGPGQKLAFGGNEIDFEGHRAQTRAGEMSELSATEVRLLRMLSEREGQVVTREELTRTLFGPYTAPKVRTLDNLVLRLRKLFEEDSRRPEHLHTVRGVGFRFTRH